MANSIKTHGAMREFLTNMMIAVRDDKGMIAQAKTIKSMADSVTENVYAETKVMQVMHQLGRDVPKLGEMQINPAKV